MTCRRDWARFVRLAAILGIATAVHPASAQTGAPDRSVAPAPGPARPLHLPETQRLKLSNGIPVFLIERHTVPLVHVLAVFRGGAAADPAGRPGLAHLTAELLDRGAGARSALEISDLEDFLGAQATAAAGWDATQVGIDVPVARMKEALGLLSDLVRRPTFPPEEIERVRQELLTEMLQSRDDPEEIAATAFPQAVFGKHTYGRRLEGDEASVRAATRDDVRGFHAARYAPADAALVVVGDVGGAAVLPLLEQAFGDWKPETPAGASVAAPPPPAPEITKRSIVLIDKPGAPQSQIWIGRVGPPRSTPDYFPLYVGNTILGGSFSARLNHNLRETKGYTYGAFSVFDYRLSTGPFVARAAVQTDKTGPALTEFFKELEGIRQDIPADELTRAKSYTALRYPAGFETDAQVAARVRDQFIYGLPADYFNAYVSRVEAVTAGEVKRAVQRWIDPNTCVVVVVGDRAKIEPQIRALALGPIRLRSIDDVMGAPKK
jgi:zinc protease